MRARKGNGVQGTGGEDQHVRGEREERQERTARQHAHSHGKGAAGQRSFILRRPVVSGGGGGGPGSPGPGHPSNTPSPLCYLLPASELALFKNFFSLVFIEVQSTPSSFRI